MTLTNFVLPNPDLAPASVHSKISGWADYVGYWAADFTYGAAGHGKIFHNQWQSYRTRANRRLELNATHDYDEPGAYTSWSRSSTSSETTPPRQRRCQ